MQLDGHDFVSGFAPQNLKVLYSKSDRQKIVAFDGEWKGNKTWSIMNIWLDETNQWAPGKTVQVPLAARGNVIRGLNDAYVVNA